MSHESRHRIRPGRLYAGGWMRSTAQGLCGAGPSATDDVSGFSHDTCFPRRTAATEMGTGWGLGRLQPPAVDVAHRDHPRRPTPEAPAAACSPPLRPCLVHPISLEKRGFPAVRGVIPTPRILPLATFPLDQCVHDVLPVVPSLRGSCLWYDSLCRTAR